MACRLEAVGSCIPNIRLANRLVIIGNGIGIGWYGFVCCSLDVVQIAVRRTQLPGGGVSIDSHVWSFEASRARFDWV